MQYLNARHTLGKLLDWGVVPVINENDTTATDEISFGDNDILAAQVATPFAADLLVVLSMWTPSTQRIRADEPDAERAREVSEPSRAPAVRDRHVDLPPRSGGTPKKVLAAEMATRPASPS